MTVHGPNRSESSKTHPEGRSHRDGGGAGSGGGGLQLASGRWGRRWTRGRQLRARARLCGGAHLRLPDCRWLFRARGMCSQGSPARGPGLCRAPRALRMRRNHGDRRVQLRRWVRAGANSEHHVSVCHGRGRRRRQRGLPGPGRRLRSHGCDGALLRGPGLHGGHPWRGSRILRSPVATQAFVRARQRSRAASGSRPAFSRSPRGISAGRGRAS
jgi:hypothetical protein